MIPRRIPLTAAEIQPHVAPAWRAPARTPAVGVWRKGCAAAMHVTFLGLFWLVVVSPVVSPIRSGELAREFKPVLDALAAQGWWTGSPRRR
jgi:hypothetical protein